MPNQISQIQVGSVTYDICDAVMGSRFNNGVLQRAYGGTGQTTADALDGEFSQPNVANINNSGDTYFQASRTDTGATIRFGIGQGGMYRGLWDDNCGNWAFYLDNDNLTRIRGWGTVKTSKKDNVTNWDAGNHTVCTVSLNNEPGTWILIGWVYFDTTGTSNTTNKNDRRVIDITTNTDTAPGNLSCVTAASIGGAMGLSTVRFVRQSLSNPPTSGSNYNLVAYHNSNSKIGIRGELDAIRVAMS